MNALIVILAVATISYQLWVHFVAVMHLKRMRDAGQLTTAQKFIGYPVLAIGLVLDIALQIIITALFLELPRELTVSGRLWRLSNGVDGWRKRIATHIRVGLLDSADPSGVHRG